MEDAGVCAEQTEDKATGSWLGHICRQTWLKEDRAVERSAPHNTLNCQTGCDSHERNHVAEP